MSTNFYTARERINNAAVAHGWTVRYGTSGTYVNLSRGRDEISVKYTARDTVATVTQTETHVGDPTSRAFVSELTARDSGKADAVLALLRRDPSPASAEASATGRTSLGTVVTELPSGDTVEILPGGKRNPVSRVHTSGAVEIVDADAYTEAAAREGRSVEIVTCGTCSRSWDDSISTSVTPAPSARCPFEAEHESSGAELPSSEVFRGALYTEPDADADADADALGELATLHGWTCVVVGTRRGIETRRYSRGSHEIRAEFTETEGRYVPPVTGGQSLANLRTTLASSPAEQQARADKRTEFRGIRNFTVRDSEISPERVSAMVHHASRVSNVVRDFSRSVDAFACATVLYDHTMEATEAAPGTPENRDRRRLARNERDDRFHALANSIAYEWHRAEGWGSQSSITVRDVRAMLIAHGVGDNYAVMKFAPELRRRVRSDFTNGRRL